MQPLAGRRLWFVGIGGAGMSALASSPRRGARRSAAPTAHGRRTSSSSGAGDRGRRSSAERRTSRAGTRSSLAAIAAGVAGAARARELLAELVALRPSIVVAGAHGKTTTTAMIAFVLDRLGLDPAFLIGGEVPQLGGNARRGDGLARRRGGRVRPLDRAAAAADRRRHERRPRPPREFALARRGRGSSSSAGSRDVPQVVRGEELEPVAVRARRARASTTGGTPRPRSRRSSSPGSTRGDAERALAEFARRRPPVRAARRGGRRHGRRRLRAPPRGGRGDDRGRARAVGPARPRPLPAAPLLPHAPPRARARRRARGGGRRRVTDVYARARSRSQGVSGKLVVDALV